MAVAKARDNDVKMSSRDIRCPRGRNRAAQPRSRLIWPDDFCETLADRGFFMARARDLGLI